MNKNKNWWDPIEDEYDLPVDYDKLEWQERRAVRVQYVKEQQNMCFYCNERLDQDAPEYITEKRIDWDLFPSGFLNHPIHLQHDHGTGMTEGAVHSYCNAVMWQYEGR